MDNVRHMPRDQADNDGFTRVPPNDLDAEAAVLGGMQSGKTGIDDASRILTPGEFYKPAHETIYRAILDLHAKGEPVDPITLAAELGRRGQLQHVGGAAYLHGLVQATPSVADVEYYAEIVHEHAVRRRVLGAALRITQAAYAGGDVDEFLATTRREFDAAATVRGSAQTGHLTGAFLDWTPFFATDFGQVDLLPGKLLAPGQQITIVGDGKAGKSLFVQEWLWRMATGQAFLGDRPQPPVSVLYVDAENGHQDIQERFLSYGAGPGRMGMLTYASFPPIRPLDTAGGGADLMSMVRETEAQVVCLDTVSRFISGPENDADTWLALYRHTLLPLKRAGIASVRLDHLGKDGERGARGSSAKTQDVDHVWELRAQGGGTLVLKRTHTRTGIGPDSFVMVRQAQKDGHRYLPGCTRHVLMEFERFEEAPEGTVEWLVARLDDLGLPDDAGNPRTIAALAHAGIKIGKDKIGAAVRMRKNRDNLGSPETFPETFPEGVPGERSPGTSNGTQKPQVKHSPGTPREPSPGLGSPPSPPLGEGKGQGTREPADAKTPLCTVCHDPLTGYRLDRGYDTHLACDPETGSHPDQPTHPADEHHGAA